MACHRLVWFVVGVGIVVLGRCALGDARREAPEVLEIRVIDAATGKAIPGVSLRYAGYSGQSPNTETTSLGPGGATRLTWSGVDRYRLRFDFTLDGRRYLVDREIRVKDKNAAALTVKIPTNLYGRPLVVSVMDAIGGKAVAGAKVHLSYSGKGVGSVEGRTQATDAKGRATFHSCGKGMYHLSVQAVDSRPLVAANILRRVTEADWKAGKLAWKVSLGKLGVLDVSVVGKDGKPARGRCWVGPLSSPRYGKSSKLDGEGKAGFLLPKGKCLVLAWAPGPGLPHGGGRGTAVVDTAKTKSVTIKLRKVHAVKIRIQIQGAQDSKEEGSFYCIFISPGQKDVVLADALVRQETTLLKGTYSVYVRVPGDRYVLLGEHTVKGPGTIKLHLKAADLDKAPKLSLEELYRTLLRGSALPGSRPASG